MDTVKFGLPISLTGRYSIQATESFQGLQLFVSEVNEAGGLLIPSFGKKVPIELIYYDDKSSVDKCKELTEKLIVNDGVDILLGPYSSSLALGAAEVAEANSKPSGTTGARRTRLRREGFLALSAVSPRLAHI